MNLPPFKLERYFAKYEFSTKYLLSSSDCDGLAQKELLDLADDQTKNFWESLTLGYTDSKGLPLLREEIAKLYKGITDEQVLLITPEEGIFIALNTILKPGDNVICTFPGYQSLYEIAQGLGCQVTKWLPNEQKDWRFDPDFLTKNIKPNTKLLIFNFPHNPTGYLPSKEDYNKILAFAREHDLYVLSDEMYRMLEYSPNDRLLSACEVYDKAISLFGMSKTFGMAGARIGWITTRDSELYDKMAAFKDYTTICSSAPSEILSLIALRAKDEIIQRHLNRIQRNVNLIESFFSKHQGMFNWNRPKAGTIAFPKLSTNIGSFEFCDKIVKEAGIMILPSNVYDYDDKHFRLGYGRENFPDALKALDDYLSKPKL